LSNSQWLGADNLFWCFFGPRPILTAVVSRSWWCAISSRKPALRTSRCNFSKVGGRQDLRLRLFPRASENLSLHEQIHFTTDISHFDDVQRRFVHPPSCTTIFLSRWWAVTVLTRFDAVYTEPASDLDIQLFRQTEGAIVITSYIDRTRRCGHLRTNCVVYKDSSWRSETKQLVWLTQIPSGLTPLGITSGAICLNPKSCHESAFVSSAMQVSSSY